MAVLSEKKQDALSERAIAVENNKINSNQLFEKVKELIIVHGDEEYKLRLTGNNKLILTK